MSIQVFPFKVNQEQVEARIITSHFLLPEDVLYFGGKPDVFAKILEINALSDADDLQSQQVRLQLLSGRLSLEPVAAIRLENNDILRYIAQSQSQLGEALTLGEEHFQADFFNLGTLTLIEGIDFPAKYRVLNAIIEAIAPFKKLVILDPLGVFEDQLPYPCLKAGEHIRFSLQHVNSKRFLDSFGETVPHSVRGQVMENVAAHWPDVAQFTGFSKLLTSGMIIESPLKNLILQSCASVIHNKVFAEVLEQVFDWQTCQQNKVTVLDLSSLQEPWKQFFYTELAYGLFLPSQANLFPVLLYPERHLEAFDDFLRNAEEKGFSLLALASQRPSPAIVGLANNRIRALPPEQMLIEGELTRGLPVSLNIALEVAQPVKTTSTLSHAIAETPQDAVVQSETELPLLSEPASHASDTPAPLEEVINSSVSGLFASSANAEAPFDAVPPEPFKPEPDQSTLAPAEGSASESIIDLSAPMKESKPNFLTPEQLHALLNATASPKTAEPSAPIEEPNAEQAFPVQEEPALSFSQTAHAQSDLHPMPQEAPIVPTLEPAFDHLEPEKPIQVENYAPVAPSVTAPPPIVPEEFHFDIDLDQKANHLSSPSESFGSDSPTLGHAIAASLNQFELSTENGISERPPGLYEAPAQAQVANSYHMEPAAAAPHYEEPLPVYSKASEVQSALDTLYPTQPTPPQAASVPAAPVGEHPLAERHSDPIPVAQKTIPQPLLGNQAFKVGDKVQHPEYGLGIVQKVIPVEESTVLNITFEQVGKRLLDPALTELSLLAAE